MTMSICVDNGKFVFSGVVFVTCVVSTFDNFKISPKKLQELM